MGTEIIGDAEEGRVIPSSHHNNLKKAISGDITPRDSGGTPTNEGASLGQSALRWLKLWVKDISSRIVDVVSVADSNLFTRVSPNELILSFSANKKVKITASDDGTLSEFNILFTQDGSNYSNGLKVTEDGIEMSDLAKLRRSHTNINSISTSIGFNGSHSTSAITWTHKGTRLKFSIEYLESGVGFHPKLNVGASTEVVFQHKQVGAGTWQDLKVISFNSSQAPEDFGNMAAYSDGGIFTIDTNYEFRLHIRDISGAGNSLVIPNSCSLVVEESY